MEHELELSTGFAVGFCYHKAADHRVCQAAHSLSCVRSCSAAAVQPVLRILRAGGGAQIVPVRQGPSLTRSICAHYSGRESCGASNRRRILSLFFWSLLTTKLLHLRPRQTGYVKEG